MTTIAQTMTPFEQFVTRLVVQVKQGATFTAEELHRHMSAFASNEGVRFTPDEMHGVMACFSSPAVVPATVTFSTSTGAQPRDDQGRYQSHAAGAPSASAGGAGAQVVTNEYQRQGLVYKELYRQILKDEDAVSRIVADSRT